MYGVDSSTGSSRETFSREPRDDQRLCSTPPRSIESYAQEEEADAAVNPTKSMATLTFATGSDAMCCTATTTLTGQRSPSSEKMGTGCKSLSAISTWCAVFIEQAAIFAAANRAHTVDGRDGDRVETYLAASLAELFVDMACQNVCGYGLAQRHRQQQSSNITQRIPPRSADDDTPAVAAAEILPSPQTSEEDGEEETPVLLQGTPSEDRMVEEALGCPSHGAFVREFVAEVIGDGLLEAVAVAVAAARRLMVQLAATGAEQKSTPSASLAKTPTAADGTSRLPEKAAGEEAEPHHQQAEVHDESDDSSVRGARRLGSTRVSPSASGVATTMRGSSPTPPTAATGGCEHIAHPSGLQVVRLPSSPLPDCCRQAGSAAAATGITVEQRARSSSAAATTSREGRHCTPPHTRKRLRNGKFVRITNVPGKNKAGIGHAVQLEAANSGGNTEARAGARCWRPSQISHQSSPQIEPPATAPVERRPRPHTAVIQGVVGIGDGRVSAAASRPSDRAVKREAKSAGAARSTAGVEVEARNGSAGGARVQLRRNRWCSPCVIGNGGSIDLEGSITSLPTTPSPSGGGGGSSREKLPFSTVDGGTQKASIVDAATPRRPPPRGQAHHISDAPERAGRRDVDSNSGVVDGDLSGTARMIYGVAIGEEGGGGAKQTAGEEDLNPSSTKSSERVFPPMSYRYNNHVQGSGPQGGTELSAAAAAVTAAAAAAVAAATAVDQRLEWEALCWRNCSNSLRPDGAESSGGRVVSTEYGMRGSGGADGDRAGGWKVAPPPRPPCGIKQLPLGNSRPGRTFGVRP